MLNTVEVRNPEGIGKMMRFDEKDIEIRKKERIKNTHDVLWYIVFFNF